MKLLFDENLAPRLAIAPSDLYPGSVHLRDCGLRGASDAEVWQYAQEKGRGHSLQGLRFFAEKFSARQSA